MKYLLRRLMNELEEGKTSVEMFPKLSEMSNHEFVNHSLKVAALAALLAEHREALHVELDRREKQLKLDRKEGD